jgi:hypothetical protein
MNYNKENPFTLGQVLSITHEVLMCDVSGLYTILNHMTGQSLYTHQLPKAGYAAAPVLREAFPTLAAIDLSHVTKTNVWGVLEELMEVYGNSLECPKLEGWTYEDPIESALAMAGGKNVIVVNH